MARSTRFVLCALVGACCSPRPDAPPPDAPTAGTIRPTAQVEPPGDAAPSAASSANPPEPPPSADTTLAADIHAQLTCELVFRAFRDPAEPDTISSIERLAVKPSDGCAAAVLFDVSTERDAIPAFGGPIQRGYVADPMHEVAGIQLADMNFDGADDLCVMWRANGSGSVIEQWRQCWLFDPRTHGFVSNDQLSQLVWPVFDPLTKTIEAGITVEGDRSMDFGRAFTGPDSFTHGRYRWSGPALEALEETTFHLHGKPDGPPPTPGNMWMTHDERRGKAMVRVFDGPCGAPRPCTP